MIHAAVKADPTGGDPDPIVRGEAVPSESGTVWQSPRARQNPGAPSTAPPELHSAPLLSWALCGLLAIVFSLWLAFSWSGYAGQYAQAGGAWRMGGTQPIEITLIRDDAHNLACASDVNVNGLHCAFKQDGQPRDSNPADLNQILRPYCSAKGEILVAAGLWNSPSLPSALPAGRFTVVCNFRVTSVLKSAQARWSEIGKFEPLKQSVPMGVLSDCSIPL
ncbi:MAG: hypothetical protein ABJB12_23260 [Pseudomonadota bacterium]